MSTPPPVPPVPEPTSPAVSSPAAPSPYTAAAVAPEVPAVVAPAAAAPAVAPVGTPMSQQPYFVPNLVVLVLSCLVVIGFWLNNPMVDLGDSNFPFGAVAAILAVGTFVASLVLRAKTKKAGGKQGLAIAAIIVSSLALVMILATVVIVAFIALMFVSFFGI